MKIAFLGPSATFCEQALRTLPDAAGAELVPCAGSPAVLAAVRTGTVAAGCVPIENTVEGAVPAVLDGLVDDPPLQIVREALLPVRFDLLARAGTRPGQVATIASHPHAIAQTRGWIAEHLPLATVLLSTSTSEAAAQVARGEFDAAVASPLAAAQHGLVALHRDIADNPGAITRFALLAPPRAPQPPTGNDRTTVAATTENRPGTLLGLLTEIAVRGIDLTRIESRPIKDRHAEYWFHLDCLGHVAEPAMGEALAALHRRCDRVRFLGSYPRAIAGPGRGGSAPVRADAVTGRGPMPGSPAVGAGGADRFAAAAAWLDGLRAGRP